MPDIRTKIVGVTFYPTVNFDDMSVDEELVMIADPANPYDKYAVRIERQNGAALGHIGKKLGLNTELSMALQAGTKYKVTVASLTGRWKYTAEGAYPEDVMAIKDFMFGVNINITKIREVQDVLQG